MALRKRRIRKGQSRTAHSSKELDCQYCLETCLVDGETHAVTCGTCTLGKAHNTQSRGAE